MAAEPQRLLMSVEDYLALDRSSLDARYEFIDVHVYMLAGGTADHSTISINMMSLLHNHLRGGPCRVYNADMRVRLTESRYVFPDVSVSCDERDRGKVDILQYPRLFGAGDVVELASLGVSFPITALYENVTLPE